MSTPQQKSSPKSYRLALGAGVTILTILFLWLLGYLLHDIGEVTMPLRQPFLDRHLDPQLVSQKEQVGRDLTDVGIATQALRTSQTLLADSTSNAERTMNQLLEYQRKTQEKQQAVAPEVQQQIAESVRLFRENSLRFQQLNDDLASASLSEQQLRSEATRLDQLLEPQQRAADEAYMHATERARWKAGALKLALLLPLLGLSLWGVLRMRRTIYGVLSYPPAIALFITTAEVAHNYFPTRLFKYVALLALIGAVLKLLIYLVQAMIRPRPDLLLKQRRESYIRQECPVCAYPIRPAAVPGALARAGRKAEITLPVPASPASLEPYTCPACGTKVYEECEACHSTRHSLLPHCLSCGADKHP